MVAKPQKRHIAAGNADPSLETGGPLESLLIRTIERANKPLHKDALLRILKLPRRRKREMDAILLLLQEKGHVIRAENGWASARNLKTVEGVLSIQRGGMAFISSPGTGRPDIAVHPANQGDAWHGDTVRAAILPGRHGKNPEGRVIAVLHRAMAELPVLAARQQKDGSWICVPSNPRIPAMFITQVDALPVPVHRDDLLLVIPGEKTGPGLWTAQATSNLEHEETPAAQERLTKSNHGIPHTFPPAALTEADRLPEHPGETDFSGRRDLRHMAFVTIDGRTARDFDDAIFVATSPAGYHLYVAIADVAHYVPEGSALDAEARLRGNSCYFPLSVEPMLPEALSNGLCSLRPHEPRLAMVVELHISGAGAVLHTECYPAVIESAARLTYGQIQRAVLFQEADERERIEAQAPGRGLLPMIGQAKDLAEILTTVRAKRGSLDFDLPETEIIIDDTGAVAGIAPRERHFGHRIIEEFMVAANEAVARFLTERTIAFPYRVHPAPDPEKLLSLSAFLQQSGLAAPGLRTGKRNGRKQTARSPVPAKERNGAAPLTTTELRAVMRENAGTPREYIVNRLILRAMMQARYTPENEGHFGLASPCYCHFTSPIRRYADLLVHRALRRALGLSSRPEEKAPSGQRLMAICEHINSTERAAAEAEREIHKRLTILYLRDKVDEVYDGVVSGITGFGIFAELPSLLAEGMIHLGSLHDDYYEFLPHRQELRGRRTNTTFRLGQRLRVRLTDVQLNRLEINLALADARSAARTSKR